MLRQQPTAGAELLCIDALGPTGGYRTRNRETIVSTAGVPVAELSIVPPLYVARSIAAQHKVAPMPAARRRAALVAAADAFLTAEVAGLTFDAYVELASQISGVPVAVTRAGARRVAEGVATASEAASPARPARAALDWREQRVAHGGAVWTRRADVLAVLAAGNGPGIHALWPQALALGYRVAVRPSRREPLTAHRLITALRHNGFRGEDVVYLPTDHRTADELVQAADVATVYGGQDVVDKYAADPTVMVNGPGRSKIVITADRDWRDYVDVIVDSVAGLAGTACVNTTAVLCQGDPVPLARAIGERLAWLEPLPVDDERAVLPTVPIAQAQTLAGYLAAKAAGTTPVLGADQVVAPLGRGCAALRPAVHVMAEPDVDTLNTELPFPCVWVSGWSPQAGVAPLRHSLVLAAITGDEALIDRLLAEPTISNVYRGRYPTHHASLEIPHDGFLPDFLMRNKGFIGD